MSSVRRVIGLLLAALDGERQRKADEVRQVTRDALVNGERADERTRRTLMALGFKEAAERLHRR